MDKNAKIYVAGHRGLVGSSLIRTLEAQGYHHLVTRTHHELDLTRQDLVEDFFKEEKPDYVILAAAKVGGIGANSSYPAEFIHENLCIQTNVIHAAFVNKVQRLLFLGSSCIYPRECPQPIKEDYLMTGPLEWTNRPYAVAKIAGIEMCSSYNRQYGTKFLAVMPTNLYGPGDNYDLEKSHVIPALIRKFHEAKVSGKPSVEIWGTGKPLREFLYVDDLSEACVFLLNQPADKVFVADKFPLYNVGFGQDITIRDLAYLVKEVVGFEGEIEFNPQKPDGTPRKILDIACIKKLGWAPNTKLTDGLVKAYHPFCEIEQSHV